MLQRPGHEASAVEFYNELARLADRESLLEARDDLRDRALMGLASKLREHVNASRSRTGLLASAYFGRNKAWPADLVGDASLALKGAVELELERGRLARMVLGPMAGGGSRRIEVGGGDGLGRLPRPLDRRGLPRVRRGADLPVQRRQRGRLVPDRGAFPGHLDGRGPRRADAGHPASATDRSTTPPLDN